jgi:hypothetical protein
LALSTASRVERQQKLLKDHVAYEASPGPLLCQDDQNYRYPEKYCIWPQRWPAAVFGIVHKIFRTLDMHRAD